MARCTIVLLGLLAVAGCKRQAVLTPEEQAVKACFDTYRNAVLVQDGAAAANQIDSPTVEYYDRILQLSLHGSEPDVRALNVIDKTLVLLIRHTVPVESARTMDGLRLFSHMVNTGHGKSDLESSGFGAVRIDGDSALAVLIQNDRPTQLNWHFQRRDDRWRIDITAQLTQTVELLERTLLQQGVSDVDPFILRGLESKSGRAPVATIWQPMIAPR